MALGLKLEPWQWLFQQLYLQLALGLEQGLHLGQGIGLGCVNLVLIARGSRDDFSVHVQPQPIEKGHLSRGGSIHLQPQLAALAQLLVNILQLHRLLLQEASPDSPL